MTAIEFLRLFKWGARHLCSGPYMCGSKVLSLFSFDRTAAWLHIYARGTCRITNSVLLLRGGE